MQFKFEIYLSATDVGEGFGGVRCSGLIKSFRDSTIMIKTLYFPNPPNPHFSHRTQVKLLSFHEVLLRA